MKTAVSLPDELFARAELAAERLGLNRSQLYARAIEDFLAAQSPDPVTAALDALADDLPAPERSLAARRLVESGAWEW